MRIAIVSPVFNDWDSALKLSAHIEAVCADQSYDVKIFFVNDGSTQQVCDTWPAGSKVVSVEVINLIRNVGHQRAIAIGLTHVSKLTGIDAVVVLDSDGEDKVQDMVSLIKESVASEKIIFAARKRRSEGLFFKVFYQTYRLAFYLLTGTSINFGNFSCIPFSQVKQLVSMSELWNHYAAGVMRSRLLMSTIPTARGTRYAGQSRMNFQSLIIHGLSAVSVFIEQVTTRIFMTTLVAMLCTCVGILAVIGIRLFTSLAIPGWTSTVVSGLTIFLLQAFSISLILTFLVLSYRNQKQFIPLFDSAAFIDTIIPGKRSS